MAVTNWESKEPERSGENWREAEDGSESRSRRKAKRGRRLLLGRSQVDPGNFARGSCKRLERLARWEMVPDAVDSVRRGRVYFPKIGENGAKNPVGI